jgi:hypothetical protein
MKSFPSTEQGAVVESIKKTNKKILDFIGHLEMTHWKFSSIDIE